MKRNPLSRYYFKHTYFCFCLKRSKARGIILVVVGRGEKGNAASEAKISAPSIVIEKKSTQALREMYRNDKRDPRGSGQSNGSVFTKYKPYFITFPECRTVYRA